MGSTTHHKLPVIPEITADQMTPTVVMLLELCHKQQEQIQALRDELARLKGQKPKPVIKPSVLEGDRAGKPKEGVLMLRTKRSKTASIEIHESIDVPPKGGVPPNE